MPKELENMVAIINFFFNMIASIKFQEFRQRFISTIALTIIFLLLILLGNPFISIFFYLLFIPIIFEYEKLADVLKKNALILKIILLQSCLFLFTIFEIYSFQILPLSINNFIFFLSFSIFINLLFLINKNANFIKIFVSNLIILSLFSLIGILHKPNGLYVFLYIVVLVSTMDILAYCGGKIFGKNKLIPKISKGKTLEGTLVGLISTISISCLIGELIQINILKSLIFGFIISILAFLGDMIESFFKRNVGVKDSGKLIPGHGGLMDRFDGYFLVLPFSYFFIN